MDKEPVYYDSIQVLGDLDLSTLPDAQVSSSFAITNSTLINTSFKNAAFLGQADFANTSFANASFSAAAFAKRANFFLSRFNSAVFSDAVFSGPVQFGLASFSGLSSFGEAIYAKEANLNLARFSDAAYFSGAKFQKDAIFGLTKFQDIASFQQAQFDGDLNFKGGSISTMLLDKAEFGKDSRIILNDTDFARFKAHWNEIEEHVVWDPGAYLALVNNYHGQVASHHPGLRSAIQERGRHSPLRQAPQ